MAKDASRQHQIIMLISLSFEFRVGPVGWGIWGMVDPSNLGAIDTKHQVCLIQWPVDLSSGEFTLHIRQPTTRNFHAVPVPEHGMSIVQMVN